MFEHLPSMHEALGSIPSTGGGGGGESLIREEKQANLCSVFLLGHMPRHLCKDRTALFPKGVLSEGAPSRAMCHKGAQERSSAVCYGSARTPAAVCPHPAAPRPSAG